MWGLAFTPEGGRLLSCSEDGTLRVWEVASGACVHVLQGYAIRFYDIAWSPESTHLVSVSKDGLVIIDVTAYTRRWVGRMHPIWIYHVAWSPDGARLASTTDDGRVYLWNASDGLPPRQLAGHHHGIVGHIEWSPDGSRFASCASEEGRGEVFVWDGESGERMRALVGYPGVIYAVAWDASGDLLVSGDGDGRLRW